MKRFKNLFLFFRLIFLISICFVINMEIKKLDVSINKQTLNKDTDLDMMNNNAKQLIYEQNKAYKSFYGTWKYSEIVSQHIRLGGDKGYENLIDTTVTYHPDYFQGSQEKYFNPIYIIQIYPIFKNKYNQFFPEQKGIEELLPNNEFFVFIQIDTKSSNTNLGYTGFNFIVKDDNTLFAFDCNCIYKLVRESYIDDYSNYVYTSEYVDYPTYQER